MARRLRVPLAIAAVAAFAALSWVAYRGYLTPEMMVYFLSFRWCY
ncbi:MAG TPA: hypothetical protein VLS49_13990 [Usitatibacter sp.]|nr:hypothetical protein [Usitatibacter sp.]